MAEMIRLLSTLFPQYQRILAQNPRIPQKILSFQGGIRYLTDQHEVGLSGLFYSLRRKKTDEPG